MPQTMTIGASESPALFGFGSPLALYERKLREDVGEEPEVPEWMEWGLRHEDAIRKKYAENHPDQNVSKIGRFNHVSVPCMHATPDGVAYPALSDPMYWHALGGLEIKTSSAFMKDSWDDGVPLRYQIQVQHQLACTGWKWGAVAVLIGGNQYHEGVLMRDDKLIAEIEERCMILAQRIESRDPPQADGHAACAEAIKRLWPITTGETMQLFGDAIEWVAILDELNEALSDAESQKAELRNKLKVAIGDCKAGILPNGRAVSYTTTNKREFVTKASSYRVLRIGKEPK